MVFQVSDTDFSKYVLAEEYKVNEVDVYDSYTDANGHEHRNIYRTQVSGTFNMMFRSLSAYKSFIQILSESKDPAGYYPCKIAVNNTGKIVERFFYLEFLPARSKKNYSREDYGTVTIAVEEY